MSRGRRDRAVPDGPDPDGVLEIDLEDGDAPTGGEPFGEIVSAGADPTGGGRAAAARARLRPWSALALAAAVAGFTAFGGIRSGADSPRAGASNVVRPDFSLITSPLPASDNPGLLGATYAITFLKTVTQADGLPVHVRFTAAGSVDLNSTCSGGGSILVTLVGAASYRQLCDGTSNGGSSASAPGTTSEKSYVLTVSPEPGTDPAAVRYSVQIGQMRLVE